MAEPSRPDLADPIPASARWPQVEEVTVPIASVYMLRTVQQHHVQLSVMADFKASILITAASILVTAFVALSSSIGLEPGIVAAAPFVLASLGFAIYAVLPKAASGGKAKPGSPEFNLFFFGHFSGLSQAEYIDEMMEIIGDPEQTFAHQLKDIYQLGTYLGKAKYRYLRYSYVALFLGVALGAIVEAVALAV